MKTNNANVITQDPQIDRRFKRSGAEEPSSQTSDGAPLAPPCVMVIFGAAGDLTKRLVVPAHYNLIGAGLLPGEYRVVGGDLASITPEPSHTGLTEQLRWLI